MTSLVRAGSFVVEAHVNWGAWAAKCGLCINGRPFRNMPGYLRPGTPAWECWICGTVTEVIWPSQKMMADVERLLMMRPDPTTRNWWPTETLHDLIFENAAHGILNNLQDQLPAGFTGTVMIIDDEAGIRLDNLPIVKPRIRQEIGT